MPRSCRLMLVLALLGLVLPGCYFSRRAADVDRTPTVDTGMGAAVILPGETAPSLPNGGVAPGGTQTTRSGPEGSSGATTGSAQPSAGNFSRIGGSSIDENRHESGQEDPLVFKWLTAPLALLAAPFAWAADEVRAEPEPGPPVPRAQPPRSEPQPPLEDYESQSIRRMEEELAQRGPTSPRSRSAARHSIADELAALQRAPEIPQAPAPPVREPVERRTDERVTAPLRDSAAVADGIVDRDGDGRVDEWIYRREGHVVRKVLDQDFDGRPDTTLHYDAQSHRLTQVEEDTDRDGAVDTWTSYRDGQIRRRRVDGDGDAQVDTWTYYEGGVITRHEQDTTADGFRDRIGHYENGRLIREQYDRNGDGRPDLTTHYDAEERVSSREEDFDGDGNVDVITHYENGRLASKELLGEPTTATP